ncbi:MAG TPA: hypothetical protein VN111_02665, partial [Ralstonia sp.]|nr:hypothetical protein [Ralstonia sp.]
MNTAELTQLAQWTEWTQAARKAILPLLAAALLSACGDHSTNILPAADQPPPAKLTGADLINRGRALVRAAD